MDRADRDQDLSAAPPTGRRLYTPTLPALDGEVELGGEAAQHARVLRLTIGEQVELFDGRGGVMPAAVVALGKGSLRCRSVGPSRTTVQSNRVVLVQCLPKSGKLDDIVRMTTELGVAEIALALSERCVARGSEREEQRLSRLERIAIEAARQSEQPFLPLFSAPRPLGEVVAAAPRSAFRAACVERTAAPLPLEIEANEVWLVVGPEGGLSPADRALLQSADFTSIALGRSILRTETAAVVGVGLALERLGRRR